MHKKIYGKDAGRVSVAAIEALEDHLLLHAQRQLLEKLDEFLEEDGWVFFILDRAVVGEDSDAEVLEAVAGLGPEEPLVMICPGSHVLEIVGPTAEGAGILDVITEALSTPAPEGCVRIAFMHTLGISVCTTEVVAGEEGDGEEDGDDPIATPDPTRGQA